MAKDDLIRDAKFVIHQDFSLDGTESKFYPLIEKLIEEELATYSNPQLREIIKS